MNQLIEFNTAGGSVFVESSEEAVGGMRGGAGQFVEKIGQSLEQTLAVVRPVADAALAACRGLATPPETVEVEFGLKFNASVGAMIASTSTEGNLRLKLILKPG